MGSSEFTFAVSQWENDDGEYCFSIVVDDEEGRTYVFARGAFEDYERCAQRIVADVKELLC